MQYRHEIGHALAKLVLFEARNCNHWRDKLRCIIGLYLGHAPANLAFVAVLTSSFALLAFSKYWRAQIAPLTDLLYISRFILLVSTVLRFASLLVPAGSDYLLFKAYRVNIAPYYLFTLKNTFHYRKLYDIRVFVWLVFSSSIHIEGYLNREFLEFCVQGLR